MDEKRIEEIRQEYAGRLKWYNKQSAKIMLNEVYSKRYSNTLPYLNYTDISEVTDRHPKTQVGEDIGLISRICYDLGLPLLSSIVVTKKEGLPGLGYYTLHEELYGVNGSKKEIYDKEVSKIKSCELKKWNILEKTLGVNPEDQKFNKLMIPSVPYSEICKAHNFMDEFPEYIKDISKVSGKIEERTQRHQELLRVLGQIFLETSYVQFHKNPMDCVAVSNSGKDPLIFEAKTLSEDRADELYQVRNALSQLLFYSEYRMGDIPCSKERLGKFAVLEHKPNEELIQFLEKFECFVLWQDEGIIDGSIHAKRLLKSNGVVIG